MHCYTRTSNQFTRFLFFNLLLALFLFPTSVYSSDKDTIQHRAHLNQEYNENVEFKGVGSQKVQMVFKDVWERYSSLQDVKIKLVKKRIRKSTMQAKQKITWASVFKGDKVFQINIHPVVQGAKNLKIEDLPEAVLRGWFAHELGHLSDYIKRRNIAMLWLGAKYVFSSSAKRKVEYEADYNAVAKNFEEEVSLMKEFILEHKDIPISYKDRIKRFYVTTEEIQIYSEEQGF